MTKKTRLRIWIVIVITCVMCFSDWSFAEDVAEFWDLAWIVNLIVSILSRIWILFAKIAWEFLTNKWVYGEILWIDVLLWQYWTIVKNMANFCLWFYLVYFIFRGLIWQAKGDGDIMKNWKKVLLWGLVAWIWIQASWFLTSVIIDVSTITLSAVGAFPAQIISSVDDVKISIEQSVKDYMGGSDWKVISSKLYTLFPEDGKANSFTKVTKTSLVKPVDQEKFFDQLVPNQDDVAGPLYYMGFCILRTYQINSVGDWSQASLKQSIINLVIQWWTTIVYSIEMGVLCVLALMRILYLWMFIVLSPLAVLLACIKKSWEKDLVWKWFIWDLMKQINLKTFLLKVFQPAVVVLWISLCMIFVSLMSKVINKDPNRNMDNFDFGWVKITSTKDPNKTTSDDETYTTKIGWDLLDFSVWHLWKWILDFMMAIITVVLVYVIIKTCVKMWWWDDFVSKSIEKLQNNVEWIMTSVPILPVAWYDDKWVPKTSYISYNGLKSLPTRKLDFMTNEKDTFVSEQLDKVMDGWWLNKGGLTASEETKFRSAWNNSRWLAILWAKRDYIKWTVGSWDGKSMILNPNATNRIWIEEFTAWLNTVKIGEITDNRWRDIVSAWQGRKEEERDLKKLFDNSIYATTYANYFGYEWNYANFSSIMDLDISKDNKK